MKFFTLDTRKFAEGRVVVLTIFTNLRKGRDKKQGRISKPEPELSFAALIGFDKVDGFFQETKPIEKS